MIKAFTVKNLKNILKGANDDAVIIIVQNGKYTDELITVNTYDYVHSTAKTGNSLEILGCGMSWNKESCNIVYLYDSKYKE